MEEGMIENGGTREGPIYNSGIEMILLCGIPYYLINNADWIPTPSFANNVGGTND